MYIRQLNAAVICITKTGSHTLESAVQRRFPDEDQSMFTGRFMHPPCSRIKQFVYENYGKQVADRCVFLAHIREPIDRFVSALNFSWGHSELPLDTAIEKTFIGFATLTFIPQVFWLDCGQNQQQLFLSQGDLLNYIGFSGEVPHLNQSTKRWARGDITSHRLFPLIQEKYRLDIELYKRLEGENKHVQRSA